MSSNEAGFNLRETFPLPRKYPVQADVMNRPNPSKGKTGWSSRYASAGWGRREPGVGSDRETWVMFVPTDRPRLASFHRQSERARQVNLNYPVAGREPRRADGLQGITAT